MKATWQNITPIRDWLHWNELGSIYGQRRLEGSWDTFRLPLLSEVPGER